MKIVKRCILLCTVLIIACGIISPKGVSGITIQQEEELANEFIKLILSHYEIIKDPLVTNYINEVGQKIVSTLPPQPFSYHFYVIKEDTYNAFATPAGHIFIYSGLLEAMDNEEELACILAHEISHVMCRHISQKIERAEKANIATLAGVVAGVLLGTAGASAAANAVTFGTMAASQSYALAYSREDERQADQIGLNVLRKAGYNGKGLISTLEKMRSKRWFDSNQIPTYLTTHPASEERMAYIDTWLEKHKKTADNIDDYYFKRAHTRLVAVYGNEDVALKKFKSDIHNHPDDPLAYYGYGSILDRKGDRKAAEKYLKAALGKRAFDPYILKDLGRLYFLDGNYRQAFSILDSAASINSNDPDILFYLGRTQVELGRLTDAVATFEKLVSKQQSYPRGLFTLGETYWKLGKKGDAHYYLGIHYKNKRDFKSAVFHLKKALENIKEPYKKAETEELLKEIRKKKSQPKKDGDHKAQKN
ncbi:MAG: M48 family metalloprotease [Deltaproteobacteria bacterium]|nr:M48 family metalloprotease [Deltaproteobacteria bacterium]